MKKCRIALILAAMAAVLCMPAFASADAKAVQVSAGEYHSLLLQEDGTMWGWGLNDVGQTGVKKTGDVYLIGAPTVAISDVKAISAGDYHTAIIKNDGTLWMCGDNSCGQLGIGKVDSEVVKVS